MSDSVIKSKILTDKAISLLSSISNIYSGNDESPSGNLISEDSRNSCSLSEENMLFKTHVTWVIKKCQLDGKPAGKYIESSYVEVGSLGVSCLWFRLYPKGKISKPPQNQSLDIGVHFKYLPENIYIVCELAFVDNFKDVFLKKIFSDYSDAVKENTVEFLNCFSCAAIDKKQLEGKLKDNLIIQCRIKLLSRVYTCVSDKFTHTVKMTYEASNLNNDILKNGKYSDVTLLAESKEVKSHRFILASESPSMHIFLKVNHRDVLELDIRHHLLQNILKYMYTGKFRIFNFSDAVDYYTTSCKYEVLNLKNLCTTYFIASLTEENVSYILDLSRKYEDEYLLNACITFIKSSNVDTKGFLKKYF